MTPGANLKCANPKCDSAARCSGTGEFFRLEILNPREALKSASRNAAPSRTGLPRLRIEEYWLCAHCAGVYTLKYDDEARHVVGTRRPPQSAEPELDLDAVEEFLPIA